MRFGVSLPTSVQVTCMTMTASRQLPIARPTGPWPSAACSPQLCFHFFLMLILHFWAHVFPCALFAVQVCIWGHPSLHARAACPDVFCHPGLNSEVCAYERLALCLVGGYIRHADICWSSNWRGKPWGLCLLPFPEFWYRTRIDVINHLTNFSSSFTSNGENQLY